MPNRVILEKTAQALEKALYSSPENVELMASLAEVYYRLGRFNERTVRLFEQVLEGKPRNLTVQNALSVGCLVVQLSQMVRDLADPTQLNLEMIGENIANVRGLLEEQKNSADLMRVLGDLLLLKGQVAEALDSYNKANNLGLSEISPILTAFEKARALHSFPADVLVHFARLYRQNRQMEAAFALYEQVLEEGTDSQEVQEEALDIVQQLYPQQFLPKLPTELQLRLTKILFRCGRSSEALLLFKLIRVEELEDFGCVKMIARHLIEEEDYRQAFDYLSRIPLDTENKELLNAITHRLEKRGELDTAVYLLRFINENDLVFKEAQEIQDHQLEMSTQLELADLHFKNQRYETALGGYFRVLQLGYDNPEPVIEKIEALLKEIPEVSKDRLLFIAHFLEEKKDYHKAIQILSRVVARDPADRESVLKLRSFYVKLLDENPNLGALRLNLGDLSMQIGECDNAIEQYRQAANLPELSIEANRRLAAAFMKTSNYHLALEKFKNLPLDTVDLDKVYELEEKFMKDGRYNEALAAATLIYGFDTKYRDVEQKVSSLAEMVKNAKEAPFTDPKMQELIGDLAAGRYRYLEKIGGGGMGVVYKVFDAKENQTLAMKILREGLSHSSRAIDRFFREARIAATLNHKNIVKIYDYHISNVHGQSFICMEHVDGPSLRELLDKKFNDDPEVTNSYISRILYYTLQLCDALDATHEKGLIHRDIKPDNIMINAQHEVKITDFGIVHIEQATFTPTGAQIGTPRYMSPEQVQGSRVDNRSDIYSVGILIYECLVGSPPFITGDIAFQQVTQIPTRPRDIVKAIPEALDNAIMKCLEKKPAERYQNSLALQDALEEIFDALGGEIPTATPTAGGAPSSGVLSDLD
ncbi:MAG: protein kinase [bacterium]